MSDERAPRSARDGLLVDRLVDEIQARIVSGAYPLGAWLRQERLADDFRVSRTPVREALHKLESAGVVHLVPHRGALVQGPQLRDIRDAYLIRAELEGLAAELAAVKASDEQLGELREAEQRCAAAGLRLADLGNGRSAAAARDEWLQANNRLHGIVQRAAGNLRLENTVIDLRRAFPRSLTGLPLAADPGLVLQRNAEHREVRLALERRDPRASRAAMHDHVLRAGELVAEHYQRSMA